MVLICTTVTVPIKTWTAGNHSVYVCICNNVTESDIENAVRDGARTLDCLAEVLAVSTCCGQCACFADECLQIALSTVSPPPAAAKLPFQLAS